MKDEEELQLKMKNLQTISINYVQNYRLRKVQVKSPNQNPKIHIHENIIQNYNLTKLEPPIVRLQFSELWT